MSAQLRGYVLDNGFLVFGDGMIQSSLAAIVVRGIEHDEFIVFDLDGDPTDFVALTPHQERNYRSMLLDCEPGGPSFMPAEASTGCEDDKLSDRLNRTRNEYRVALDDYLAAHKEKNP